MENTTYVIGKCIFSLPRGGQGEFVGFFTIKTRGHFRGFVGQNEKSGDGNAMI